MDEVAMLLTAADTLSHAGDVADKLLRCAVYLAVHTGLHKGELLALRWRDVDLLARRLTIRSSFAITPKVGKSRHLRVPSEVIPILSAWSQECPKNPEGLLFPRFYAGAWSMYPMHRSASGS